MTNFLRGWQDERTQALQNLQAEQTLKSNDLRLQAGAMELEQKKLDLAKQARVSAMFMGQPAPSLVQHGQTTTAQDPLAIRQQAADTYTRVGSSLLSSGNPKDAAEFLKTGEELNKDVRAEQAMNLKQAYEVTKHVSSWMGTVEDQATLDNARQQLEVRHPGIWKDSGLPDVYDAKSATMFKQMAMASSNAEQQVAIKLKEIDLQTRAAWEKARLEEAQAKTVEARADAALKRDKLDSGKSDKTAREKVEIAIENETKQYEKEKLAITSNPVKYSAKAKTHWLSPDELSPQAQALANVETAHQNRLTALKARADRVGVILPTITPAQGNSNPILQKLKEANPATSEEELVAYAKSKGYIQ